MFYKIPKKKKIHKKMLIKNNTIDSYQECTFTYIFNDFRIYKVHSIDASLVRT